MIHPAKLGIFCNFAGYAIESTIKKQIHMSINDLNEQEQIRRDSLAKLRELGIEPYPAALYPVNTSAREIKDGYKAEEGNFQDVVIAGRIMSRRIMGAASFGEIQDETGRIQIYVNRDEICPGEDKTMYNTVWKKLLDIGDIIGIKGFAFITMVFDITSSKLCPATEARSLT